MQTNEYIKQAKEMISAGVIHIDASERNLILLSSALRAADKEDMASSRSFLALLNR